MSGCLSVILVKVAFSNADVVLLKRIIPSIKNRRLMTSVTDARLSNHKM